MTVATKTGEAVWAERPHSSGAGAPAVRSTLRLICMAPLRLLWQLTRPIRRPLVARFDRRIVTLMGADFRALSEQMNCLSTQVMQSNERHLNAVREMNVFVEGLVREVARLQSQMLALSQLCAQNLSHERPPASWYEPEEIADAPLSRP